MEQHQVYGLATPEDFVLPPHHPLWSEETYTAFQFTPDASEKYDTKASPLSLLALIALAPPTAGLGQSGGDWSCSGTRHSAWEGA